LTPWKSTRTRQLCDCTIIFTSLSLMMFWSWSLRMFW